MIKRYNIFVIARLYLRNYYKFVVNETNIRKQSDAQILFKYAMKKLYNLDTVEYSPVIDKYGRMCVIYLSETPDTPKVINKISFEDRVKIVSICEGYAIATNILSNKNITNNRLREG